MLDSCAQRLIETHQPNGIKMVAQNYGIGYTAEQIDQINKISIFLTQEGLMSESRVREIISSPLDEDEFRMMQDNPEHYGAVLFERRMNSDEIRVLDKYTPSRFNVFKQGEYNHTSKAWHCVEWMMYYEQHGVSPSPEKEAELVSSSGGRHHVFHMLAERVLGQRVYYPWLSKLEAKIHSIKEAERRRAKELEERSALGLINESSILTNSNSWNPVVPVYMEPNPIFVR